MDGHLIDRDGHKYCVELKLTNGDRYQWIPSSNTWTYQLAVFNQLVNNNAAEMKTPIGVYRIAPELLPYAYGDADICGDCGGVGQSCICGPSLEEEPNGRW